MWQVAISSSATCASHSAIQSLLRIRPFNIFPSSKRQDKSPLIEIAEAVTMSVNLLPKSSVE